ncbi:Cd(II)/Pb(II)-responsive transcriptional regulator [uncultured Rhodoferax sp.]|uniref:Cd(II)/Pb(II)-responsive transcriptional regulator n=1 Tax=uncultured Rhodoferax sp. TaxID=223188 RepID=UPI0025CC4FB5|nr:Cd(II)/Pb(II)-responsive transcriptional regulator [uncultured Rhodoferax sp.]
MKIGELAKITQTQTETIRFYEREGLLGEPPRSEGNYRLYMPEHLERLAFIRHCRSLDMTLDEIRALLCFQDAPRDNCHVINEVLDGHIEHVASRIRELKYLQQELKALREQCDGVAAECGILDGLKKVKSRGQGAVHGSGVRASAGRQPPRSVRGRQIGHALP